MEIDKTNQITYSDAITELEAIVKQLDDEIDVDVLAEKVKRASYLIKLCKTKLRSTEDEVKKVLEDIEKTEGKTDEDKDSEPF